MNFEQIKGVIERGVTLIVAWAIGKGYVPAALGGDIIIVVVGIASIAWGFWVNTPKALANAAEATK